MAWDLAQILFSAGLAAFLSGYLISRWRSRDETITQQLQDLCDEIAMVASDASSYWQMGPADSETRLLSYKVLAGVGRTNGYQSILTQQMSMSAANEIAAAGAKFLRAATGGEFGVHNRPSDTERAEQILLEGAAFVVAVKQARMRDLEGVWIRRR